MCLFANYLFMYPFCHDVQFEIMWAPVWPGCLLFLFKDSMSWYGSLNAQSNPVLCPPRNFQLVPITASLVSKHRTFTALEALVSLFWPPYVAREDLELCFHPDLFLLLRVCVYLCVYVMGVRAGACRGQKRLWVSWSWSHNGYASGTGAGNQIQVLSKSGKCS